MANVHKTAILEGNIKLDDDVEIGAFCVLTGDITIKKGTKLYNNVCIYANKNSKIIIGENNRFFPFSVIGTEPQDNKFIGEESNVEIGDNNTIREYCTINGGSNVGNILANTKNLTKICNGCYLYISSHVAHDVYLEDRVVLTNYAGIAGHVKIGHDTIIGGLSGVHQFVNIGHNVMIGGACAIGNDIPPYAIVMANPSNVNGVNIIGCKRTGMQIEDIKILNAFYDDLLNKNNTSMKVADVIEKYKNNENKHIKDICEFIKNGGKRGWMN